MYNDVEYYVVYSEGDAHKVTCVYYNQFNRAVFHADGKVQVDDENGEFTLNGSTYRIQDGMVLWISSDITFDTKYICDIRNNMFVLDGLWCILSDDGTKVEYAKVDDNELKKQYFAENGESHWTEFGLKFKFSNDERNTVSIMRRVQFQVVGRLAEEWSEYGDIEIGFDYDKTWDWYIAKFILDFKQKYPQMSGNILSLGNGVLYDGKLDTACEIELYSKGQDGIVMSNLILRIVNENGSVSTTDFGTVFEGNLAPIELGDDENKRLKIADGRYVEGSVEDGLIQE